MLSDMPQITMYNASAHRWKCESVAPHSSSPSSWGSPNAVIFYLRGSQGSRLCPSGSSRWREPCTAPCPSLCPIHHQKALTSRAQLVSKEMQRYEKTSPSSNPFQIPINKCLGCPRARGWPREGDLLLSGARKLKVLTQALQL